MKMIKTVFLSLIISILLIQPTFSEVIFEDNFEGFSSGWQPSMTDTGWHVYPWGDGGYSLKDFEPSIHNLRSKNNDNSWNGWVNNHPDSTIEISSDEGRNGTPCLKIGFAPGKEWVEDVGLIKWLGPNRYQEIYIRYYFKYGDGWKWYNGTNTGAFLWKQLRVWSGVTLDNYNDPQKRYPLFDKTLSKESNWGDSVVPRLAWGNYGSNSGPFMAHMTFHNTYPNCTMGSDCDSQNCGSNCQRYYWDSSAEGQVTTWCGPLNADGTFRDQQVWHCIEYRIKYNSSETSNDGIFEVWLDGNKLSNPNISGTMKSVMPSPPDYGINMIVFNANQHNLTPYWGETTKYYYIDDIVISTTLIGKSEDTTSIIKPIPPKNLNIK